MKSLNLRCSPQAPDVYVDILIVLFYHLPLHSCCQGQSASGRPSSLWLIFVLCLLCSLKESFFWDFLFLVKDCLPQSPPQCWDYRTPGDSTLASESACNCHLDNKLFPTFFSHPFKDQRNLLSGRKRVCDHLFCFKDNFLDLIKFLFKVLCTTLQSDKNFAKDKFGS